MCGNISKTWINRLYTKSIYSIAGDLLVKLERRQRLQLTVTKQLEPFRDEAARRALGVIEVMRRGGVAERVIGTV